jgi:exosome complex exonuclease DIS3/RRP44
MSDSEDDDNLSNASDDDVIGLAPVLYERTTYFRQARKKGKILQQVQEHYKRDDLGFGCSFVNDGSVRHKQVQTVVGKPRVIASVNDLLDLMGDQQDQIVIVDTNVLLHNMDVLEQVNCPIVVPQTALIETKKNRMVAYDRTVDLLRSVSQQAGGLQRCCIFFSDIHHAETSTVATTIKSETINNVNDASIRNVAHYFGRHLKGTRIKVILLTDDADNRQRAAKESKFYQPMSVKSWVELLEQKDPGLALMDLVAQFSIAPNGGIYNTKDAPPLFPPHLDASELSRGVQTGTYHRGVYRSQRTNGMVTIRRGDDRVAVTILEGPDQNRAINDDVIAVALNPLDKWINQNDIDNSKNRQEKDLATAGIANETAEPTLMELENITRESLIPTGRVVGILRRNFNNQSGSIMRKSFNTKMSQLTEKEKIASEHEREHADGSVTCVFFPVDKTIPPILIRTTQRERLLSQRIIVSVDSWPVNSRFPLGHYVSTIGPAGDKDVETKVLLLEHDIPHQPFPASVLACLPPENYKIDTNNSPGREDLRHLPVLSIVSCLMV